MNFFRNIPCPSFVILLPVLNSYWFYFDIAVVGNVPKNILQLLVMELFLGTVAKNANIKKVAPSIILSFFD